jgi:hypothetical protein
MSSLTSELKINSVETSHNEISHFVRNDKTIIQ